VLIEPAPVPFPFTLAMLDDMLPSDGTFGEEGVLFLNHNVSRSYTLDEYVAAFRSLNMTEVADALAQVGAQAGMVGQVARIWDAQGACPDTMGIAFEFDFALFNTPEGALTYLNDPALQAAWIHTGSITDYAPIDGDTLLVHGGYTDKSCGPVYVTELRQLYGRVLAAISITHYPSVARSDVEAFLNTSMTDLGTAFTGLN
jgi:hypothetical protein